MQGPHQGQPVQQAGEPLERARAAMIMVHGRGDRAEGILELARTVEAPGFSFLAPQAAGNTWYPNRFMAPLASNEPGISSGMRVIGDLLDRLDGAGVPAARSILLGFSQGACLVLEYAARHSRRYGGVVALSGGLIGPDDTSRAYPGSLEGTPVLIGCSDVDSHIPLARVELSADVMRALGADVTLRVYPGMGHTVNADEIELIRGMTARIGEAA